MARNTNLAWGLLALSALLGACAEGQTLDEERLATLVRNPGGAKATGGASGGAPGGSSFGGAPLGASSSGGSTLGGATSGGFTAGGVGGLLGGTTNGGVSSGGTTNSGGNGGITSGGTPSGGATNSGGTGGSEPSTCSNTMQDGDETATDCGGSCTAKCEIDAGCAASRDCKSLFCDPTTMKCAAPTSCLAQNRATCPCSPQNAGDKVKCEEYVDCYIREACNPNEACGANDGACGVNKIGGGNAPLNAAKAVYTCACP